MKKGFFILFLLSISFSFAQDLPPPTGSAPPPPSYNAIGLKVYFDNSFVDRRLKIRIDRFLNIKGLGFVVDKKDKSNLHIAYDGSNYLITKLPEKHIIYKLDNSKPEKTLSLFKDKLSAYAYGYQIRKLKLKNKDYQFSFKLIPAEYNPETSELETVVTNTNNDGTINFNTDDSAAFLEVTNHSNNPIYFSVIEINSKGQLNAFIPNVACPLLGNERQIPPRKTVRFKSCYFQFAPPYETLTLKGFASPEPINFNPLIKNKDDRSLEYIEDFYTQMYTYEFNYNIVDDNGGMPYETSVDIYKPKTNPELQSAISELDNIKSLNGELSIEYTKSLQKISNLHAALGNTEESNNYKKRYTLLSEVLEENNNTEISSSDIELLQKQLKEKNEKINILKKEITRLKELLEKNSMTNGLNRGVQAVSEKIDVAAEFSYRALIIAEQNYKDQAISDLQFPIKDATEFMDVITKQYAFKPSNVTFLKDPTRKEIFEALQKLYKISTDKDHLLIFYAGHGVYDEGFKRGYWLPSDAELESKSSWMSNLDIKDFITNIKTKHTLLISDACFSGSIFEFNRDIESQESNKVVEKLLQKNARNAMTSGLDKPVPDESVFIKYLLKALKENESIHLKASDLFKNIQEVVLANTDNIPQYGVIRNANHEGGEFIFLRQKD